METSSAGRPSATRSSTPSYRPQISTSHGSAASSRTRAWSRRRPAGERRRVRRSPGPRVSTAAKMGAACITIPGPPPYGSSSTWRCRSSACSRMSWTRTSRTPDSMALPNRLSRSGLSKMPGKMVRMSTRTAAGYRGPSGKETLDLPDGDPPGLQVDAGHDVADRGDQDLPVSLSGHPHVVGGIVEDLSDAAQRPSTLADHVHPHHLVDPVRPLGRGRGLVGGHQEHLAPKALGLVPIGDLLELHQEAVAVGPGLLHSEPPAVLKAKDRAGLVPRGHLAQVQDGDLTADAVGPGDPADRQELLVRNQGSLA